MEVPPSYFDSSSFSITATGSVFGLLLGCGFGLAMLLSTFQCSKQDSGISFTEGLYWSAFPTIVYVLLQISPWFLSIFTKGLSSTLGYVGYKTDTASYETVAIVYALILAGLIVTTRMVHSVEVSVCKPSTAELSAFKKKLMAELKEKETAKNAVNKPSS